MTVVLRTRVGAVRFDVRVQPRAARNEIAGEHGGALRVRLQAAPVEGAANEALVKFLAETLDVPRRHVRIVSGAGSRNKIVEIDEVARPALDRILTPI
ncbi:MAG TPA: DUF167 domain-containing protein [Gemmatimonadaceae bacterium]